ncbi:MAG: hypothetical protein K5669_11065 [Lachnospiraceae bacterium]|nr:hypothetical protein [Lachnospiraceae bacterium]
MKKIIVMTLIALMLVQPMTVYGRTKSEQEAIEKAKVEYEAIVEEYEGILNGKNVFDCDEYHNAYKEYRIKVQDNAYYRFFVGDVHWSNDTEEEYVNETLNDFTRLYLHADVDSEWLRKGNTSAIGIVFRMTLNGEDEIEYFRENYAIPEDDGACLYFKTELLYKNNYTRIVSLPLFDDFSYEIDEIYCDNLPLTSLYVNGEKSEGKLFDDTDKALEGDNKHKALTVEFTLGTPLTEDEFISKYGSISYDDTIKIALDTESYVGIRELVDGWGNDKEPTKAPKNTKTPEYTKAPENVPVTPTKEPITLVGDRNTEEETDNQRVPFWVYLIIVGIAGVGVGIFLIIKKKKQ